MGWTVLILEDDDTLREVLVETLEDFDCYTVLAAARPSQALQIAQGKRLDLLITDVRMDEMDGIQCLERLRAAQPGLRSIVITGFADNDAPGRAILAEAEDYLYKPFSIATFLTSVERVLQVEKERNLYAQLVGAVNLGLAKLGRMAGAAISQAELSSLDQGRDRAFQSFYVAVRSGALGPGDALGVWDRLEQLENDREQLKVPGYHGKERQALSEGYRYVAQLLAALGRSPQMGQPSSRKPHQATPQEFSKMYRRIKSGDLSTEQVKLAAFLRLLPPEARAGNSEVADLYARTWG
ncbi:MAG: response regulator [Candidatus Eremiobacterota bacterium]